MVAISRIAVMEGALDEVSIVEVLQVISIGRQYTVVELRRPDQSPAGTLFVKSGKLIGAASAETRGKEAFFRLVPESGAVTFHIFRTDTPVSVPEPIGSLGSLLMEALERGAPALPAPTEETVSATANNATSVASKQAPAQPAERRASAPAIAAAPARRAQQEEVQSRPSAPSAATLPQQRSPVAVAPIKDASRPAPHPRVSQNAPRGNTERPAQANAQRPAQARMPQPAPSPAPERRRPPQRTVSGAVSVAQEPPFVIALASPKGGSGKTTLALNLAVTLARQNRRVILLDADINGDIASAIDARDRARYGVFDVLTGGASVEQALLNTVMPDFKIMPATGTAPIDPSIVASDTTEQWRTLLGQVAAKTDIVLVDTPAGMLGPTHSVLRSASHVLGVLQAELIAYRSFSMFARGLDALPDGERPRVLGVVLNMVQPAALASVTVLQQACVNLPREWLLEASIPRSNVFLEASEAGLPLRLLDDERPPALAFMFETLAGELMSRLEIAEPVRRPQRLLA